MSTLATYVFGHPGSGYFFDKLIQVNNDIPEEVGNAVCEYIQEYFNTALITDADNDMSIVPTYVLSVKKGGFTTCKDAWNFFEKNPDKGVYLPTIMYLSSFFNPEKGMFWSDESTAKAVIEVFTACIGVPGKAKEEIKIKLPVELYEGIRESGIKPERYIEVKLMRAVLNQCFSLNSLGRSIVEGLEEARIIVPTPIPTLISKDGLKPVITLPKFRIKTDNSKFYSFKIDKRLTSYIKDYLKYSNNKETVPLTLSKFVSDVVCA